MVAGKCTAALALGTLCGLCGVRAFLPIATVPRSTTRLGVLPGGSGGAYDLLGGKSLPPVKTGGEYDLLGGSSSPASSSDIPLLEGDPNEALLAELVFSTEDVRELVFKRLDDCNGQFLEFLQNKINDSTDLDERGALKSLVGVIEGVKAVVQKRLEAEAALEAEEEQEALAYEAKLQKEVEIAKQRSVAEQRVLEEQRQKEAEAKRMQEMMADKAELEGLQAMDAQQSFEQMLEAFLGLDYSDVNYVKQVVNANYERCTIEFLDILGARVNSAETPEPVKQKLSIVRQCIETIMQERMARASEKLATLVKSGPPDAIIDKVYEMAKQGEVDEPLILLLEVNQQQAKKAGAEPAAQLFNQLLTAAREAIDQTLTPARRLIRRLIRMDDAEQRKELINQAFRPKAQALLADGSKTDADPDVPPPEFINELQILIKNFGNVEDAFREKLVTLVAEGEEVSTSIYGQPMSIKEQQDYMWEKATLSVFDLEKLENKAAEMGDMMPWQNDKYDTMLPPGFEEDGTRKIGGGRNKSF